MNLAACAGLLATATPENRVWYRVIELANLGTALSSAHTKKRSARFNPGSKLAATQQFAILGLSEDSVVAQYEAEAVLGNYRVWQAVPGLTLVTLDVSVVLSAVVDLTDVAVQAALGTTAQELTGDWEGYDLRTIRGASVRVPAGIAPTQELGHALFAAGAEGFRAVSAKIPNRRNLFVFPESLRRGSSVTFTDPSGSVVHRIP